jgi:methylenetetrahydrofolate dehydrogenase (NADP+)/methenyltetrahydrofolate cyclohydrolase
MADLQFPATDLAAPQNQPWILDGKAMAALTRLEVAKDVAALTARGIVPGLAVALVGDDAASQVYVGSKVKACAEVGMVSTLERLPATTTQAELETLLLRWNADPAIDGILVQFPLPKGLNQQRIIDLIDPAKDVDGFGAENLGKLAAGRSGLVACTPSGVMDILRRYGKNSGFQIAGKHAVVLGRSVTVGRPMALLLLNADATVTVCHSRTPNIAAHIQQADIVVAAVGQRHMVQGAWLKPGAVVVDVGIHRGEDGKLSGDVDYAAALPRVAAITPVPGGVGPMTIAHLLRNTVLACQSRRG